MSESPGAGKPLQAPAQKYQVKTSRYYTSQQRLALVQGSHAYAGTAEAFCREHGLSASSLYVWRRAFQTHGAVGLEAGLHGRSAKRRKTIRQYTPEQRREAVEGLAKSGLTQEDFAKRWGVTPRILRIWVKAYAAFGPKGLEGHPGRKLGRRPVPAGTAAAIMAVKTRYPTFGLRKVRDFLARFQGVKASAPVIRRVVAETPLPQGSMPVKRRVMRPKPRFFERARPGQLWQSDLTSMTLPRTGQRVYLVVFLDDHSRYVVSWRLALRATADMVQECLLEGISRFGKPLEVLTDQGPQYFSWRGKADFQKLLAKQGIKHALARTHHPQTLGKCERLWATLKEELWSRIEPTDLLDGQQRLGHFFAHYNHFRTHQGLDGSVPADRFFGADVEVRSALESRLAKNELALALGEAPRQAVFLVGQIGGQAVSLHGERGTLVFQTADGERRELAYDALGMASGRPSAEEGSDDEPGRDDSEHGGNDGGGHERVSDGNDGGDAVAEGAAGLGATQDGVRDAAAGVAGEGAVGGGERSGAGGSAPGGGVAAGTLAGPPDAGGTGGEDRATAGAGLAAEPAGVERAGGGAVETAAEAAGGDAATAAASGGGSEGAPDAGGDGGTPAGCAGGSGEDPAGVAGEPGIGAAGDGSGPGTAETAGPAEGEKKPADGVDPSGSGSGATGEASGQLTGAGSPPVSG